MDSDSEIRGLTQLTEILPAVRGELHRYLARMSGSVIDGEDLLQDTLLAAAVALQSGADVQNMRAWLFRIAHNTALNMFRSRKREAAMKDYFIHLPPAEQSIVNDTVPEALAPYLSLTPTQRSIVILRDVLGYSATEVAELTDCSVAAVKSSLRRGRLALVDARAEPAPNHAALSGDQNLALRKYVDLFNAHDFDGLRDMLSAEVRLELVSVDRREGKAQVSGYFSNYAKRDDWRMVPGIVEGRPAILAGERNLNATLPAYFILLNVNSSGVDYIRDFRYARYAMQDAVWSFLE